MPRRLLSLSLALVAGCAGIATDRGDTIVFASGADLQSINPLLTTHPLARQVQRYVLLTTLVRYDSALQLQPYLARQWRWSPDRTIVTLTLSTAVRWHDGVVTTAHDVAWTLDAARDPATGYPRVSDLAAVSHVDAPSDSLIVITFDKPMDGLPDVFSDLAILPAHLLDTIPHGRLREAAWNQAPVGNGPFRFVSHAPNRRWVFAANPDFPPALDGPPHIARLVIAVVDEPTTKLAALASGELDFAGINPAHAAFVRRNPALAVVQYPLLFSYAIVFNTRHAPFNDLRVRRAVALAVDRAAIVNGYLFGFATPATGPEIPRGSPTAAAPPDVAAARALIGNRPVSFELLTVGSGEAALEQLLQAELAPAGIHLTIRQLELSSYLDRVQGPAHEFDAAVMGMSGDLDLGQLPPLLRAAGMPATGTRSAMLQRVLDSVPAAYLYHAGGVQGMNRRVEGVQMDIRGELATLHSWRVRR